MYGIFMFIAYFVVAKVDWASAGTPRILDWQTNDWAFLTFALLFAVLQNLVTEPLARETILKADLQVTKQKLEQIESSCPILNVRATTVRSTFTEKAGTEQAAVEEAIYLVLVIENLGGKAKQIDGEWRAATDWPTGAKGVLADEDYSMLWSKNNPTGSIAPDRAGRVSLIRCSLQKQRIDFLHIFQNQLRTVSIQAPTLEMKLEIWMDSEPHMMKGAITGSVDIKICYGADGVPSIEHHLEIARRRAVPRDIDCRVEGKDAQVIGKL
jgi:hypothetical protein